MKQKPNLRLIPFAITLKKPDLKGRTKLTELVIPERERGRWKTGDVYASMAVAKEWDLLPSDLGVCHPYEDNDMMFFYEVARAKQESYDNYLNRLEIESKKK